MDMTWLAGIGAWAGDKGAFIGVIGIQSALIWKLLSRLLKQQDVLIDALRVNVRAMEVAERSATTEV